MGFIDYVVTIVTIMLFLSGSTIQPTREIRQDEPISSYLFLICAEGLSALLTKAETESRIKGIKVARVCQSLSHLLFADDSILFNRAKLSN